MHPQAASAPGLTRTIQQHEEPHNSYKVPPETDAFQKKTSNIWFIYMEDLHNNIRDIYLSVK